MSHGSRPIGTSTIYAAVEHANGEDAVDRLKLYGGFVYVASVVRDGSDEFVADSQRWYLSPSDDPQEHDEEDAVCAAAAIVTNIVLELREMYGVDTDVFFNQLKRDFQEPTL